MVMAHARRSPQHRAPSSSISSPSTTRRKTLRRPSNRLSAEPPAEFVSSPLPKAGRPVLVPLQPNLRRLPSRIHLAEKDVQSQLMRESSHVIAGSKRKRVVSSNENNHTHGRSTRGSGRQKRPRTASTTPHTFYQQTTSEESLSDASDMDVDANSVTEMASNASEDGDAPEDDDEEEQEEENDDSCTFNPYLTLEIDAYPGCS